MRARVLGLLLVVFGALQFVPRVGVPDAYAGTGPDGVVYSCLSSSYDAKPAGCDRGKAYSQCAALADWYKSPAGGNKTDANCYLSGTIYSGTWWSYRVRRDANYVYPGYFNGGACPAGTTWDEYTKKCFDPAVCLAKSPIGNGGTVNLTAASMRCSDGCQFSYEGPQQTLTTSAGVTLTIAYGGAFKPTGAACTASDPDMASGDSSPPKQTCTPVEGQTFCIRDDGYHCYSATTGRQICWQPGETGEKADGPLLQKRNAGTSPLAPQASPPPGDSFSPSGNSVGLQSSQGGTSVTQNFITVNGSNASGSTTSTGGTIGVESGEPDDGSAPNNGGNGDGGGDTNFPAGGTEGTTGAAETDTAIWHEKTESDLFGLLDDSGFLGGGSTCPPLPMIDLGSFGVYSPQPAGWCDWVAAIAALVMFLASIAALRILME